ncbi:MAG: hypothetical protein LBD01_01665 [Puniceicoccales bacterium]|jgi:hypothetical protein|nr:hypothetical protein [Puniceicoccales bacterium]
MFLIKKLLHTLVVLLFLAAIRATSAPMDTTGLPITTRGVIHMDFDTGGRSPFAVTLGQYFLGTSGRNARDWQEILGFDLTQDVSGITCGLIPGSPAGSSPQGIFILRGNFSPAKVVATALRKGAKSKTIGKYAFIDVGSLPELVPFGKKRKILFAAINNRTLLLADEDSASAAVEALDGKTPSYKAAETPTTFAEKAGVPFLYVYLDKALFPSAKPDNMETLLPPDEVQIVLSDNGHNVAFRFAATYPLALDAQRAKARFQALLGLFRMAPSESRNASEKALEEKLSQLHAAAKLDGTDRKFNLSVNYPTSDAIWLLANAAPKPGAINL